MIKVGTEKGSEGVRVRKAGMVFRYTGTMYIADSLPITNK